MEIKSILTNDMDYCFLCGKPRQHIHHCMNAANPKKTEKYGLLIPVCSKCHSWIHDKDDNMKFVRQIAQRKFEEKYSRELWMEEFGKNYL